MNERNSGADDLTVMSFPSNSAQQSQSPSASTTSSHVANKTGYCYIIAFVIIGFYFLVFAIIQLSTNFNQIDYEIYLYKRNHTQYISDDTFVSFTDKSQVLVYLKIQHITQIDYPLIENIIEQCDGKRTNREMGKTISVMNTTLNPDQPAIPCGWFDTHYPEGRLEIVNLADNSSIEIVTSGIGPKDIPDQSHNIDLTKQWVNMESQRYQNWVTADAQEKVQKLWGKIYQLFSGSFQIKLTVNDEMPHVDRIVIYLNNDQALSGYNYELCIINFFYAVLVFVGALANFLIQKKCSHRKVLKKKPLSSRQSSQIKVFLNSISSSPGTKFE